VDLEVQGGALGAHQERRRQRRDGAMEARRPARPSWWARVEPWEPLTRRGGGRAGRDREGQGEAVVVGRARPWRPRAGASEPLTRRGGIPGAAGLGRGPGEPGLSRRSPSPGGAAPQARRGWGGPWRAAARASWWARGGAAGAHHQGGGRAGRDPGRGRRGGPERQPGRGWGGAPGPWMRPSQPLTRRGGIQALAGLGWARAVPLGAASGAAEARPTGPSKGGRWG
jgi:hypothetical protein